jgi:hypothetical protein
MALGPFCAAQTVEPAPEGQADEDPFSPAQYNWAIHWINGPLETLMAHSVIERISVSDTNFQVRTGEAWGQISFRQAGEILSRFSRARQITGHSPFFTVEQNDTGTICARVTQESIAILVPDEGYFEYIPDTAERENTAY